jgi:hypothetical protein
VTPAVEYLVNKDFFTGKQIRATDERDSEISAAQFRNSPEWLQRAVGYKRDGQFEEVNPTFAWLMQEIPYSRFIGLMKQVYVKDTKQVDYASLASTLLGQRVYKYDPNTQQYYRDRSRIEHMERALRRIHVLKTRNDTSTTFKQRRREQE